MLDIIRDSTVGQLVNFFSDGRLLPYPEQKPGFVLSAQFVLPNSGASSSLSDSDDAKKSKTFEPDEALSREDTFVVGEKEAGTKLDAPSDPRLVGWYSNDDQDNPRNWSASKRAFVAVCISLMTFTMYIGSAIYTPSIPGIRDYLNISLPHATLGLTLYILGYGIGPMFLSPLQELPRLGRNTVYMVSFVLFIAFQIPILTANNIQTILACRFFTGIFGSPALATGGASMGDIYPFHQLPYVLGIWGIGAVGGPIAGPVVGGFAAQANVRADLALWFQLHLFGVLASGDV
ncbi:hypothetical protein D9757_005017 [Collybiopsis confluens]|uniref:Major facilitator superfamily (MFS) profile domain-containing protein n=1 Tax=Collybiopsis confluens TaxID=2823264 RepID=A0A8H5MC38_9AGAR|nr:hypothetical protein D9757_005017 [Collybiopsis confluens]